MQPPASWFVGESSGCRFELATFNMHLSLIGFFSPPGLAVGDEIFCAVEVTKCRFDFGVNEDAGDRLSDLGSGINLATDG